MHIFFKQINTFAQKIGNPILRPAYDEQKVTLRRFQSRFGKCKSEKARARTTIPKGVGMSLNVFAKSLVQKKHPMLTPLLVFGTHGLESRCGIRVLNSSAGDVVGVYLGIVYTGGSAWRSRAQDFRLLGLKVVLPIADMVRSKRWPLSPELATITSGHHRG